jgi:hypothetical protein
MQFGYDPCYNNSLPSPHNLHPLYGRADEEVE